MICLNGCGPMQEVHYEGVEIDVCPDCIGVWLDDTELTTIVLSRERAWPPGVVARVLELTGTMGVPLHELKRSLFCPKCDARLDPVNYQDNSGIIVNPCPARHGVWLDHGELAKIQIFMEHWRAQTGSQ